MVIVKKSSPKNLSANCQSTVGWNWNAIFNLPFILYSDNKQLTELHPEIVKNTSQTISQCPYKKKPSNLKAMSIRFDTDTQEVITIRENAKLPFLLVFIIDTVHVSTILYLIWRSMLWSTQLKMGTILLTYTVQSYSYLQTTLCWIYDNLMIILLQPLCSPFNIH